MMISHFTAYLEPIFAACVVFPLVAALFTLPFMVMNYRKFGGIALMRVVVVYSFILYSMCAFLLTVLPLPSREAVAAMPARPIGWIPGHDLAVGLRKAGITTVGTWFDLQAWKRFLRSSDLFQVLANIVMQIPLGFYLRYYFRCSWKKTLVIGLCVSLFYELTQLSGLFFIYPHNYRYTEVDDLIANTLGALIGYWITPVLAHFLPTRDEIDRISYDKGNRLTLTRRVTAMMIDLLLFSLLTSVISFSFPNAVSLIRITRGEYILICTLLYFAVLPYMAGGRLPGHALLKLKVVRQKDGKPPRVWQLLVRYGVLYIIEPLLFYLAVFAAAGAVLLAMADGMASVFTVIMVIACVGFVVGCGWWVFNTLRKYNCLPHSHLSGTTVVRQEKHDTESLT